MAKVIGIGSATSADQTIYNRAFGSGSLLLKAHDQARGNTWLDLTIYGQESFDRSRSLGRAQIEAAEFRVRLLPKHLFQQPAKTRIARSSP